MLNRFHHAIQEATAPFTESVDSNSLTAFLHNIQQIVDSLNMDNVVRMTKLTIFFEGLYRSLLENSELKKSLLKVRIQRWSQNFGVPTVPFLISYLTTIEAICQEFKTARLDSNFAFTITLQNSVEDITNEVLIEDKAIYNVEVPELETAKQFIKTYNPTGGYTLLPDAYSQEFIEFAIAATANGGKVLEIGAAFGAATLKVLSGAGVIDCNDIEPKNLAVISQRYAAMTHTCTQSFSGGSDKLNLLPGAFPEELSGMPTQSYKAILACRVLHFFPGQKIEYALQRMAELLEPEGKLFVICETPYQKNWLAFLPEYNRRSAAGDEWPGEIQDSSLYEKSERRGKELPKFIHQLTTKELLRSAKNTGMLAVEKCDYISREKEFSDDALLDGRESVGLIARRMV